MTGEQGFFLLLVLVIIFTLLGTLGVLGSPDKNKYFVATGDGDTKVTYSEDGKNWNTVSDLFGDGGSGNKVVVDGKRYLVVGEDGDSLNRTAYYAYANNMSDWTPITWNDDGPDSNNGTTIDCVSIGQSPNVDKKCVHGLGDVGAGQSGISYSLDGDSYQLATGTPFEDGGAAYVQTIDIGTISDKSKYWIICGNEDTNTGIVYTAPFDTPQTWTAATIPTFTNVVLAGFSIGTTLDQPYLIAGTTTNTLPIAWSDPSDGTSYTKSTGAVDVGDETSAGTYSVQAMNYGENMLICCGETGSGLSGVGFSLDGGKTWKQCIVTNGSEVTVFTAVFWNTINNAWFMTTGSGAVYESPGLVNGDVTWTINETLSTGTGVEITSFATDGKTKVVTSIGDITLYKLDSAIEVIDDIFDSQGNDVIYG